MSKSVGGVRYSHSGPSSDFKEFRAYSRDWEKTYFDHQTGGFVVTHKERIESGDKSNEERRIFRIEQEMAREMAELGHKIEHLSDQNRPKGKTYDINFDGKPAEFKNLTTVGNIQKRIVHAVNNQGAKVVIARLDSIKEGTMKALKDAKRHSGGKILYYTLNDHTLREV